MQDNLKKIKCDNALKIFVTIAMVLVLCASLVLSICAPVFTSKGVASAIDVTLPDNGIVGENLLPNSYFLDSSFSPSNAVSLNNWYYTQFNGATFTFSNGLLSNSSGRGGCELVIAFDNLIEGADYTFTFYCSNFTGNCSISVRNSTALNTPSSVVASKSIKSNYTSLSFSASTGVYKFLITLVGSSSISSVYSKLEKGSSFTGYVPGYKHTIDDLNNKIKQLNAEKSDLQTQYNNLLNSMDFSTFNSVDLNSTKPLIASTTMGNSIGSSTAIVTYKDITHGGYWYYRNSVEKDPYSLGLAEFDIGSTLLAGSDIKISYDALFPYNGTFPDNVGVVLTFSNFGVYSSASNLKLASVFISASDFTFKEFIYNFDFDVNYITFGVGTFDSSSNTFNDITLGYNVNTSVKQGVFISNFVVKGRGSNFNVAIDNAKKDGYNKGYQEGKVAGREVGYQEGIKDNGDYTFMGLLGAVFDAPIQAFKGLLNFEILGVDMTAFVSSLFALAVIVVIIKISLGGK